MARARWPPGGLIDQTRGPKRVFVANSRSGPIAPHAAGSKGRHRKGTQLGTQLFSPASPRAYKLCGRTNP